MVTRRESVDGEDRRFVLGWGHPRRREASSLLCFLPGSWAARAPGGLWKRQGHWHNSSKKGLPESGVGCGPMETAGPTLAFHFSTLSSFSMSKAEKQDGAGSCLHCVVRVAS